mmetsp:Transcript_69592/g.163617  ORF Transcript_69592/g.163617 Transcript_69592/m.163617 type:complete len:553 (+) Transcript_69592:4046-5704(+)
MGADNAAADDAVAGLVEDQLGEAFVAAVGDRAARGRPREQALGDGDALGLGLVLGHAHPGDLGVGVGHARDHAGVELALGQFLVAQQLAGNDLGRHMALVHRLVGQHGLADDVTDGEHARDIGAHLHVDRDEAAVADDDAGVLGADLLAVGRAAHGLQHQVVALGLLGSAFAFEGHPDAIRPGFSSDRLRVQQDVVEAVLVELLPDLDEIAVRASHQRGQHFDDVQARAQRGVHRAHFEADDAAADDEHLLGLDLHLQRAGRVDDARVVRQKGQAHRLRARRDDQALEGHRLHCTGLGLADGALGRFDLQVLSIQHGADTAQHGDLAHLGHGREAPGQFAGDLVLVGAQLVDVDRGRAEGHAQVGHVADLVHDRRDVQQGLGRDAAHVQADTAQRRVALDEGDLQAQVRRAEGGRVAAGAATEHDHVEGLIGAAGVGGGRRGLNRCRGSHGSRRSSGRRRCGRCRSAAFQRKDARALADLVAQLDLELGDHASGAGRDLHRGLVTLDGDQALLDLDGVADLDQHLDDADFVEVADVGNLNFNACHDSRLQKL